MIENKRGTTPNSVSVIWMTRAFSASLILMGVLALSVPARNPAAGNK
jgi:hypothetical protein